MNERAIKLYQDAIEFAYKTIGKEHSDTAYFQGAIAGKLAELVVSECTNLLFDESERLYAYSTECDNMRESDEAELVAEKCVDLITMIEEHFGVEE